MSEHCPNPSCGRPIPPDQSIPWCLTCGEMFPESLQLRMPKPQEAEFLARREDLRARMAELQAKLVESETPSLASRWGAGFLILLVGWVITFWMFHTFGDLIDLLHRGEEDSSNLLFALNCVVYLILGPLIVSAYSESGLKLSQPWSSWLRGFKTLLIGALVLLPCLLLVLGAQGMIRLGGIEEGSEQARLLWLLVMFMMIVLVPFSMAPLFRWLSRSPLAEQASWVNERLSPPHSTFRGH